MMREAMTDEGPSVHPAGPPSDIEMTWTRSSAALSIASTTISSATEPVHPFCRRKTMSVVRYTGLLQHDKRAHKDTVTAELGSRSNTSEIEGVHVGADDTRNVGCEQPVIFLVKTGGAVDELAAACSHPCPPQSLGSLSGTGTGLVSALYASPLKKKGFSG